MPLGSPLKIDFTRQKNSVWSQQSNYFSHGFTLTYGAMLVIRNIFKRILTRTNVGKDLNSLSADKG